DMPSCPMAEPATQSALHARRACAREIVSMSETPFPAVAAAIRKTLEGQGFTRLVGAEVVSVDPGVVVMGLDRRAEVLQQNGLFHGGVSAYRVDNATTAAAATMIDRARRSVITAEYKLNLVAPSTGDRLTCRAEVVKPGRSLTVVDAKVTCRTDGEEK